MKLPRSRVEDESDRDGSRSACSWLGGRERGGGVGSVLRAACRSCYRRFFMGDFSRTLDAVDHAETE